MLLTQQIQKLWQKAERQQAKTIDENETHGQRYLQLGLDALARHADPQERETQLLEKAQTAFHQALEHQPGLPEALSGLSQASLSLGQYQLAERQAQMAIVAASVSDQAAPYTEASTVLGTIQLHRGEFQEARNSFAQALRKKTDKEGHSAALMGWGLAQWSLARLAPSRWQRLQLLPSAISAALLAACFHRSKSLLSLKALRRAIAISWGCFEAQALQSAGEMPLSQQTLLKLTERFPGHAGVSMALATAYRAQNDRLMAGFWFQKILNRHPGHLKALSGLLELAKSQEDTVRQVSLAERMTQWRPSSADAWCHLANAYVEAKNYAEAINAYKTALHLSDKPQWKAGIASTLGEIYLEAFGDLATAQAYYEMARLLDPANVENYKELGELYYHSQSFTNAELLNRQAIRLDANDARLHAKLAYLYKEEGRIEAAMSSYRQAMTLDNNYTLPLHNLGNLYLDACAEPEQAIELFKQALEARPDDAIAAYNLGRAYSLCGKRVEAARYFQQAQILDQAAEKTQFESAYLMACLVELFD
jgi:tetratricopeptide (TPR) repeat protein